MEGYYTRILLFFGLLCVFIVPPFQMVDEDSHFKKAYLVSNFVILPDVIDGHYGNLLPKSLLEFEHNHRYMIRDVTQKYNYSKFYFSYALPQDYSEKQFATFSTSKTHPLLYLPQASGILVAKIMFLFNEDLLTPGTILYAGRIGNLLFFALCFYFAVKWIPFLKRTAVLVGLMPMTMGLASSLNYDAMVIGVSLLFIAYVFKLAYTNDSIGTKEIVILCVFSIALIEMKMVYFPLLGLFFLVPKKKFKSTWDYIKNFAIIVFSGIFVHAAWGLITRIGLASPSDDSGYILDQAKFILNNPVNYTGILIRSIFENFQFYIISFVGNLGWLDTNFPYVFIFGYLLFLVLASLFDSNGIALKASNRLLLFFVFISIVILIETSLYLIWTSIPEIGGIGYPVITGVQGRYFIPCSLALLAIFSNALLSRSKWGGKTTVVLDRCLPMFVLFSCILMDLILILRYWVPEV